jgi:hypothetical protein
MKLWLVFVVLAFLAWGDVPMLHAGQTGLRQARCAPCAWARLPRRCWCPWASWG